VNQLLQHILAWWSWIIDFYMHFGMKEPEQLSRYSNGLWAGRPGFDSRKGEESVLFSAAPRPALGPIKPPIQWVQGALSHGVKRLGRKANHPTPSGAEVKNGGAILPLPVCLYGVVFN
jgi:hypothetical protein